MFTTLIQADTLHDHSEASEWRIVDCRSSLSDTEAGRRAYREGHIPGALYAHLEEDLSGPIIPGKTGRHPLPCMTAMERLFSNMGIAPDTQVVVYDDSKGAIAARLWWMLRYVGHDKVAVLDGGLARWRQAGYPMTDVIPEIAPTSFKASPRPDWYINKQETDNWRQAAGFALVDSREAPRYRGEVEPIDPVAGHIPGAVNLPFAGNWTPEGLMLSPEALRERFAHLPDAAHTAFYCGSGVTACHNLLAYAHAGLGDARLYAGSWSEWIAG
ncbi:MAG: sulfurtransferase [Saprospiraceae bacterium]